jgi:hypothetical protein
LALWIRISRADIVQVVWRIFLVQAWDNAKVCEIAEMKMSSAFYAIARYGHFQTFAMGRDCFVVIALAEFNAVATLGPAVIVDPLNGDLARPNCTRATV